MNGGRYVRDNSKSAHRILCSDLLLPIFDPVIIRCDERAIVLLGYQNYTRGDKALMQVKQARWLRCTD